MPWTYVARWDGLSALLVSDSKQILLLVTNCTVGFWVDVGEHHKAAKAFSDAKLYLRAAESYEYVQMYIEAADALWKGKEFNELVRCLVGYVFLSLGLTP